MYKEPVKVVKPVNTGSFIGLHFTASQVSQVVNLIFAMNFRFSPPIQYCVKNGESKAVKVVKPVKDSNSPLANDGKIELYGYHIELD